MKKLFLAIIIVISMITSLAACGEEKEAPSQEAQWLIPEASSQEIFVSNLNSSVELEELQKAFGSEPINPGPMFKNIRNFNKWAGNKAGLSLGWIDLKDIEYNFEEISKNWEKNSPDFQDINCRLSAFSFIEPLITVTPLLSSSNLNSSVQSGQVENTLDYHTYLMMDVDAIETNPALEPIKPEINKFISVFNPVSTKEVYEFSSKALGREVTELSNDALYFLFTEAWEKRGVQFPEGNLSLISVIMEDKESQVLFVGHTGILMEYQDGYVYFEKPAPSTPYQVFRFKDLEQLKSELLSRKAFYEKEGAQEPLLYKNNMRF